MAVNTYRYKNVAINGNDSSTGEFITFTSGSSTSNAYFKSTNAPPGILHQPTTLNMFIPKPLHYLQPISGVPTDLQNICTAQSTIYNDPTQAYYNIPTHCKSFRAFAIGGGGGGAGGAGGASAKSNYPAPANNATRKGGNGGDGGYGTYVYLTSATSVTSQGGTIISVQIGLGGAGGTAGKSNSNYVSSKTNNNNTAATGDNGNVGSPGDATTIAYAGTTILTAPGGAGGNLGNNAKAAMTKGGNISNSANGNGNSDPRNPPTASINPATGGVITSTAGNPGNGGDGGGNSPNFQPSAGNAGTNGAAQIIWLYD
jgi:hypothetical protein